ncbi:hypothetical protein ACF06P_34855 [Streptomyces sp. NPDC015684]|uniref:hypothetical protein n=1 Tax=Streptomyces sp. NPDC015684 TaxID=3364963 RepID=UPI0036F510D6
MKNQIKKAPAGALPPEYADQLFTAREQGATEQQLQQIAADGLARMYFRASNSRAHGLGAEFSDVEHIQTELQAGSRTNASPSALRLPGARRFGTLRKGRRSGRAHGTTECPTSGPRGKFRVRCWPALMGLMAGL